MMDKNKNDAYTEIAFGIFGDECEISSYKNRGTQSLLFLFDTDLNGYITVDNLVVTVRDGKGRFDARLLSRGDYEPKLIVDGRVISLPSIRKTERGVFPMPPDDGYIRSLSLRELELRKKVEALEGAINGLCDKVYGKTIF